MNYRSEIDGLRGLSVILIVLFHCNVVYFNGGFIGVDIFFVISGYIISTIILREIDQKKFSILRFYERRIRRIIPCLLLVVFFSLFVSWHYFYYYEINEFSKSLLAIIFLIPNFFFYFHSSYFDSLESYNFLLHTWSLGIEEQFYLIFPFIMIILFKFKQQLIIFLTLFIIICNLLLIQFSGNFNLNPPYINEEFRFFNQSAFFSFYLLSSRFWELLFGVLVSFYFRFDNNKKNKGNNILAIIGLLLIFFSVYYFNSITPFPSIFSIIPVFGTVLIILFSQNTILAKILSLNLFNFVGKLSFSIYLWHNPVTFIINREFNIENSFILFVLVFSSTFFLSFFSWKYVENYFRNSEICSKKNLFTYIIFMSCCIITFCAVFITSDKFVKNKLSFKSKYFLENYKGNIYSQAEQKKSCLRFEQNMNPKNTCFQISNIKKNIIIWGDSVANSLSYGIRNKYSNKFNILETTSGSCTPRIQLQNFGSNCYKNNLKFKSLIRTRKINTVIFTVFDKFELINFKEIENFLSENKVEKIIFIGPNLNWQPSLPKYIALNNIDLSKQSKINVKKNLFKENEIMKKRLNNFPKITHINVLDELCKNGECIFQIPKKEHNDSLIIYDDNHYSLIGSKYIADKLINLN